MSRRPRRRCAARRPRGRARACSRPAASPRTASPGRSPATPCRPSSIDPASTDTSVPSDAATRFVTLYLVQGDDTAGDALVAVRREVAVPADAADLPAGRGRGPHRRRPRRAGPRPTWSTRIPSDVQVRSARGRRRRRARPRPHQPGQRRELAAAPRRRPAGVHPHRPRRPAGRARCASRSTARRSRCRSRAAWPPPAPRSSREPTSPPLHSRPPGDHRLRRSAALGPSASRPSAGSEGEALELARAGVGQLVDDEHVLRALVGGQVGPGVGHAPRRASTSPTTAAHTRWPQRSSSTPNTATSSHARAASTQDVLDLGRVHVHAAGDDEVVAPAVEVEVAVVVEAAEVADGEGVAPPGRGRARRVAPVLEPGVRRAPSHQIDAVVVDREARGAGRARPTVPGRASHSALGQAVNWPSVEP